jgi:hypothetical protein
VGIRGFAFGSLDLIRTYWVDPTGHLYSVCFVVVMGFRA